MKFLSLTSEIRKNAHLDKTEALYIFAGGNQIVKLGILLKYNSDHDIDYTMGELEKLYADKDGILNLLYTEQEKFGGYT